MQNPCAVANSGNLTLKVTALVTKGRRRREDDALKNVPSICGFDVHFLRYCSQRRRGGIVLPGSTTKYQVVMFQEIKKMATGGGN